jgi:CcdB protein
MPRQFEVYANPNKAARAARPYIIVVQHDFLATLRSRIVAPIRRSEPGLAADGLNLPFRINGKDYAVIMSELAAIPIAGLSKVVQFAPDLRDAIVRAIDRLVTGL